MPVTCPNLAPLKGISHGFFGRQGGSSTGLYDSLNCGYGSGDDISTVESNRDRVARALGLSAHTELCTAFQVHSPTVATLHSPWAWKDAPEADALVTATPGLGISILTADCLPVLFADADNRVIGAAHAGWKGAFSGVLEATLGAMSALGAKPESICATIGPAISQASYEVGPEFRARFVEQAPQHAGYFAASTREGHFLFDLKAYALSRLKTAGVWQINLLAHDTCFEENAFFSYRRSCLRGEPVYGRQISAIVLDR
jgi:YfiH family protein